MSNETIVKEIKPYFAWKKDYGENDCWNVYIDPNKEEETQKQMKEHNTNTSRSVDQETPSNPNTLSDEQSEKTDQEINKNIEPINKLKVLILSNETISNKLPLFPRYIYWNDSGELNEIIFTLIGRTRLIVSNIKKIQITKNYYL